MTASIVSPTSAANRWRQYMALTKPRVVQLIVFCAVIGMLLAEPGWPRWGLVGLASAGIWLVAAAARTGSHLVVRDLGLNPTRTGVLGVLRRMGASLREEDGPSGPGEPCGSVEIRGGDLRGTVILGRHRMAPRGRQNIMYKFFVPPLFLGPALHNPGFDNLSANTDKVDNAPPLPAKPDPFFLAALQ
jgi:hypothetical protein